MSLAKEQIEELVRSVPCWYHSIDLGHGVVTPGGDSQSMLALLRLPDLRGKSVLDIGAFDGYFSFTAERLGARRVVALDHYVWSMDLAEHVRHYEECKRAGVAPAPYHTMPYWRPTDLPGKRGFDIAHRVLGSKVEAVVADFMDMDLGGLGAFDVVLYLGVLYHMEDPLRALRRVAAVTGELAVVETAAVALPGYEHAAVCEFYESSELNFDVSNWWAPNVKALEGLCRAAGFRRVEVIYRPEAAAHPPTRAGGEVIRGRAIAHAWK
ncbi:MAG TPA: DUF1698 domain-containing protein [Gemmataceae bacterium]|nr:DUF1698 domain-containing protein [Gemmataceae bacterium]